MESEARALGAWRDDPRVIVKLSAGRVDRAREAVAELVAEGVSRLLSWGLCGGLDPALRPGDVVECAPDEILTPNEALASREGKADAWAKGRRIVDLESGPVAEADLPGWAIRVVLDEAGFALPAPALVPLRADGTPALGAILRAVLGRPGSIPAMIGLARRHGRAMAALRGAAPRVGEVLRRLDRDGGEGRGVTPPRGASGSPDATGA
jgi:hypothetical protein